jgi:pimeloyl-ACP methyl ester carboxylesterase
MTEEAPSRRVTLPDHRIVEVWEGGSPTGKPVVYHHGSPSCRLQAALGDASARLHDVRLISFSRPGYGRSTNTPPSLASVGRDTILVADALGVEKFAVLGASGGGPYAIATGLADPDRVRAVGVVAGVGPWRLIEPPNDDDPDLPLLALADTGDVTGALDGFRRLGAQEYDALLAMDEDAMLDELLRNAPRDDLGWLDQHARVCWAADMREALTTYDGYARDNVSWGGAWDIDPSRLTVPTWLWYGDLDRMVPVSHGHWLAERIARSTLIVRPGDGHGSTVFGHWSDMLATLWVPKDRR